VGGSLLEPEPVDQLEPVGPVQPVGRTEPVARTAVARAAVPVQSCRICHTLFEATGDAQGDRLCSKSCRRISARRADRPGRGAGRSA